MVLMLRSRDVLIRSRGALIGRGFNVEYNVRVLATDR